MGCNEAEKAVSGLGVLCEVFENNRPEAWERQVVAVVAVRVVIFIVYFGQDACGC